MFTQDHEITLNFEYKIENLNFNDNAFVHISPLIDKEMRVMDKGVFCKKTITTTVKDKDNIEHMIDITNEVVDFKVEFDHNKYDIVGFLENQTKIRITETINYLRDEYINHHNITECILEKN